MAALNQTGEKKRGLNHQPKSKTIILCNMILKVVLLIPYQWLDTCSQIYGINHGHMLRKNSVSFKL